MGDIILTEDEKQKCAEARVCSMTMQNSARQVIKELLEIIERLSKPIER